MGTKTLAELAALAALHVQGFKRPTRTYPRAKRGQWDDSKQALTLAVIACEGDWEPFYVRPVDPDNATQALLVALLRAHGVEA